MFLSFTFWPLVVGLEAGHTPYSKSHARRLKRRAREQLANGMDDIRAVINALDENTAGLGPGARPAEEPTDAHGDAPKPKGLPGQIGEGKGAPLTKSQRKRALFVPL